MGPGIGGQGSGFWVKLRARGALGMGQKNVKCEK